MSTYMQLKPYPFTGDWWSSYACSIPQALNNEELLIIPYSNAADSLYKYNIKKNEYYPYLKYPNDLKTLYDTTSLNTNKTLLYIFNENGKIIEVDLKKETFTTFDGYSFDGAHAKSLFINDEFHVFGGWNKTVASHFIWNKQKQKLKEIYKYKFVDDTIYEECQSVLAMHAVAHIKWRKSVLIIVGNNTDKIYEYSLITNECNLLSATLTNLIYDPCCVVSKNEQFVIIFGHSVGKSCIINILDLKQMRIRESKINIAKCNKENVEVIQVVIINDDNIDELCVFGYIRQIWNLPQFTNIQQMPFYLIKLIKRWYSNEIIHVFNSKGHTHCVIGLDDVLKC